MKFSSTQNAKYRDGYHYSSKYWSDHKATLTNLPPFLKEVIIGACLGDLSIQRTSSHAFLKFEYSIIHKEHLFHMFDLFKDFCFQVEPLVYYHPKTDIIRSYYFKTWGLPIFDFYRDLFYPDGVKVFTPGIVMDYLTPVGLAYWIMDDGSLDGNTMIIHSQAFSEAENMELSAELNKKFNLNSYVIPHKEIYTVIKIPYTDADTWRNLVSPYIIPSMRYKLFEH